MENVNIPEIKAAQSFRRKKGNMENGMEMSDAFMQIIDSMIQNMQGDMTLHDVTQSELMNVIPCGDSELTYGESGAITMRSDMIAAIGKLFTDRNEQMPEGFSAVFDSFNVDSVLGKNFSPVSQQVAQQAVIQQNTVTVPISGVQPQLENTAVTLNPIILNGADSQAGLTGVEQAAENQTSVESNKPFVIEDVPVIEAKYTQGDTANVSYKGITVPTIISNRVVVQDKSELMGEQSKDDVVSQKEENKETFTQVLNENAQVKYEAQTPEIKPVETVSAKDFKIVDQINNGIKENFDVGKSEFVLRLKPESLGEITLKLAEKSGKMVLEITTASANTAKLINMDLNALKDVVRPMNVEVHDVTVQVPQTTNSNATNLDMAGQQFTNQQNSYENQNSNYHAQRSFLSEDDSFINETALTSDGLDTYV